jgi:ABC-type antimicrobial peptide transport system permease subunit
LSAAILPPPGVNAAAAMPDILPPVKPKKGFIGFLRRNPTIAIGGFLVLTMVFVAVFAPFLFTKDPTALAPAMRTREPSAQWWFGTDMLGRDVLSAGRSIMMNIDDGSGACLYDFKAEFTNGQVLTRYNVNVCQIADYYYTR